VGKAALYVAVAFALQLTAPLWAGRLPHLPPAWLIRLARRLVWTRSPLALSMAFHEQHHALPRRPTARLGQA
jgi:hypothetical protein